MVIGIDLGTTFSAAAYIAEDGRPRIIPNRDGQNTTPSVVMFDEDEIIIGQQAKNNAQCDPANVVQFVKRQMGSKNFEFISDSDQHYSAEDISARILKRIIEDCEAHLNEKVTHAVITVPAYFSDPQRIATRDAGNIAGVEVIGIINEPTAAALAYGAGRSKHERVMIYDLGGGTFDVTIMDVDRDQIKVLATHGNKNLGGFNFDNALISYVAAQFQEMTGIDIDDDDEAMQVLRMRCEEAKIALSSAEKYKISISAQRCKPVKIEITRDKFNELTAGLILETEDSVDVALDESGLSARDIDKVLLVGGSTRIPAVRAFIEKKMNMKPSIELNPDEAVAMGAAVYAQHLMENGSAAPTGGSSAPAATSASTAMTVVDEKIQDVNSHGLGIVAVGDSNRLQNFILIPRNTSIPAVGSEEFFTQVDNQPGFDMRVTEGDDDDLDYVEVIGTAEIKFRPHPAGSPVRVELGYSKDGIIVGRVFDMVDQVYVGDITIKRDANLTADELRLKKQRINTEDIQ
nr:Hsp70 family protein [Clostridia bacterium]